MPGGRPSKYTQTLADSICEELAMGNSMRTVCKAEEMPSPATIFSWMRTNKEFLEQYTRAKQESADGMAEEILDISDTSVNDYMEVHHGDDDEECGWRVNHEALARSKLRVDTRKFLMAKMKPKKYGDKLALDHSGTVTYKPVIKRLDGSMPEDEEE